MPAARKQTPKETRIRWNPEERAQIIAKTRELMNSGKSFSQSALLAQRVLPPSRRRPSLPAGSKIQWLKDGVGANGALMPDSRSSMPPNTVVDAIAAIVVGVLQHPAVRDAVTRLGAQRKRK